MADKDFPPGVLRRRWSAQLTNRWPDEELVEIACAGLSATASPMSRGWLASSPFDGVLDFNEDPRHPARLLTGYDAWILAGLVSFNQLLDLVDPGGMVYPWTALPSRRDAKVLAISHSSFTEVNDNDPHNLGECEMPTLMHGSAPFPHLASAARGQASCIDLGEHYETWLARDSERASKRARLAQVQQLDACLLYTSDAADE